jgi:hypothetical protein
MLGDVRGMMDLSQKGILMMEKKEQEKLSCVRCKKQTYSME